MPLMGLNRATAQAPTNSKSHQLGCEPHQNGGPEHCPSDYDTRHLPVPHPQPVMTAEQTAAFSTGKMPQDSPSPSTGHMAGVNCAPLTTKHAACARCWASSCQLLRLERKEAVCHRLEGASPSPAPSALPACPENSPGARLHSELGSAVLRGPTQLPLGTGRRLETATCWLLTRAYSPGRPVRLRVLGPRCCQERRTRWRR